MFKKNLLSLVFLQGSGLAALIITFGHFYSGIFNSMVRLELVCSALFSCTRLVVQLCHTSLA